MEIRHNGIRRALRLLIAYVIAFVWVYIVYKKCGIYFETNDDRFIGEMLSGVITVKPDGHVVYVNYLLAKPLALCYQFFPGISWYGGFLIAMHIGIWGSILHVVWGYCRKIHEYAIGTAMVALLFLCSLQLLGNIQFTSTAALLAITGYVCILLERDNRLGYLYLFLFEFLSFLLRENAMLMIQPIGIAALGGLVWYRKGISVKKRILTLLKAAVILVVILAVGKTANLVAYQSEEWQDYIAFNDAGTILFDYYECPGYMEVKPILDRYGVTKAEYNAYISYVILNKDLSTQCVEELADYVRSVQKTDQSPVSYCKDFPRYYFQDAQGLRVLIMIVWGAAFLYVLFGKNSRLLLPLFGIALGELVVWMYLIHGGRMPFRVVFPLCLAELFLLLAVVFYDFQTGEKQRSIRIILGILGLLLCWRGYLSGQIQYRHVCSTNASQRIMMEGFFELQEYCRNRPENKYIIGQRTQSYFTGAALDGNIYRKRNNIVSGSWYAASPSSDLLVSQYLSDDLTNTYFILYQAEESMDEAAILYLTEKTGYEPREVDRFSLSFGGQYSVYYFGE